MALLELELLLKEQKTVPQDKRSCKVRLSQWSLVPTSLGNLSLPVHMKLSYRSALCIQCL